MHVAAVIQNAVYWQMQSEASFAAALAAMLHVHKVTDMPYAGQRSQSPEAADW